MVLLIGHHRRIVGKIASPSIAYVNIYRVAITIHLPHCRHLHRAPRCVVVTYCEEVGRTLVGILNPVESPSAVERKAIGVVLIAIDPSCLLGGVENLVRGVHWSAIYLVEFGVTPLVEALCHKRSACH